MTENFYSRDVIVYTGGDRIFSISFPYIEKEDIEVTVNGTVTTNFSFLTDSTISITDTLSTNDVVCIYRKTDIDKKEVTFTNQSILDENAQNIAQDQVFFAIQELYDNNEIYKKELKAYVEKRLTEIENYVEKRLKAIEDKYKELAETVKKLWGSVASLAEIAKNIESIKKLADNIEEIKECNKNLPSIIGAVGNASRYVTYAINKARCQAESSNVDFVLNREAIDNGERPSTINYGVGGEYPDLVVTTAKGKTVKKTSMASLNVSNFVTTYGEGLWTRCLMADGTFRFVHHANFAWSTANSNYKQQYTLEGFPDGIIIQNTSVDPFEVLEMDSTGNWAEFEGVPLETFLIEADDNGVFGVSMLFYQLAKIGVNSFNFNQNAAVYGILTMYNLPLVEINTNTTLSSILTQQTDNTFKLDCRKNLGFDYAVEDFPYGLKERLNIELELNSSELEDVYVSANTDALSCYTENGVCQYFQYIGKTENGKLYTSFEIPMYTPDMYLKFEKLGVAMDVEVDKFKLEALGYQETRIESGSVKVVEEEPPTYNSLKFKTRTVSSLNMGDANQSLSVDWGDETVEELSSGGAITHTYAAEGIYTVTITPKDVDYLIVGNSDDTALYPFTHGSEYLLPMPECRTVYGGQAVPIKNVEISCGIVYPENFMINNPSVSHLHINQSADDVVSIATTAFGNLLLETIDCDVSGYNPLASGNSWDFSFIQNLISSNALMLKALKAPYTAIVLSSALGMMSQLEVLVTDGASAGMCDALSSLKYVGFNDLSEIPTDLFGTSLTNLERVVFDHGDYSSVPLGLFTNTPALKSFKFSYNWNPNYVDLASLNFDSCPLLGQDVIPSESARYVSCPDSLDKKSGKYIGLCCAFEHMYIKNIPSGLFTNSQHVKNVDYMFYNARVQTALPELLFNKNVLESAESCFKNCLFVSTSPIPTALFKNSPNLKNLASVFENTNITSIPTNFFEGCSLLENLTSAFEYCDDLAEVPTFLFRWSGRSVPINFTSVFQNCKNIVLPSGLFYLSIDYQFAYACCGAATEVNSSISQSLFDTSKSTRFMGNYSVDLSHCFYGAGNSGAALPDLWTYTFNEETVNRTGCYVNAVGTNSAEIPDLWKQEV